MHRISSEQSKLTMWDVRSTIALLRITPFPLQMSMIHLIADVIFEIFSSGTRMS